MKKLLFFLFTTALFMGCQKEPAPTTSPNLLFPLDGAILDNNCEDLSDEITWEFDWDDFPGATRYHLFVMHQGSIYPVIDNEILVSEYKSSGTGSYIVNHNLKNWFWRVRAFVDGNWTEWSEERSFSVEPLNTDC